jgi:hypothetical protein
VARLAPRVVLLLIACSPVFAANHFVRSGASGTGSGADWTNACTDFTGSCAVASLVRGDTYYVATGTYAGRTFSKADSGSLVITIKGATSADHGIATGWLDSFSVSTSDGGAQAIWSGEIDFTTDFYVWDGIVGSTWDNTATDYGFRFSDGLARGTTIGTVGSSGVCGSATHDITFAHFYAKATATDVEKEFEEGNTFGGVLTNVKFSHFLIDGWQGLFMTKSGNCSGTAYTGWIVEYGVMLNGYSSAANHGEWVNPNERDLSGVIIRYNVFRQHSGSSGMTGTIVANNSNNTNAFIYGNVFDTLLVGNGVITGTSAGNLNSATIYNNTFLNLVSPSGAWACGSGNGTLNVAQNNIVYNQDATIGSGCTTDWDAYFSTTNTPTETHRQTGASNPFVSSASFNYNLTTDTTAGNTIAANIPAGCTEGVNCVDTDAFGVQRGANGTWDRGALQIAGGSPVVSTPLFSPVGGTFATAQTVTITSLTASVTICYTLDGTAPTANGAGTCTHGTTLANGGTVTVSSSETVQALGSLSGDTDSAVGSATYTIGIPVASLSPASLSFGGINISNTSAPQTLTLQNTGTAVMSITSISLTGANTGDFFQSNNCPVGSNLGNGASCTITVTFTPLAVGARSASVSVVDGASGSPHTSALSGTGVQALLSGQMNPGARMSGRAVLK